MREAFTNHLRQALDKAQDEARRLNQDFVSTEHLLLGLLASDGTEAAAGLKLAGVSLSELRERLAGTLPRGDEAPVVTGLLPLSPKAHRAVNDALVKAQALGASRVSSRLLLGSLLHDCDTVVRETMSHVGADLDHLQRVLAQDGVVPQED